MRAALVLCSALATAPLRADPGLQEAAALYHRGRYDSALAVLDALRPAVQKRKDSLSLYQYSGMASARLGRADRATADFRAMLGLDSLFQFPRNEDPSILDAFENARAPGGAEGEGPTPAPAGMARAGDTAPPARVAYAGGRPAQLPTAPGDPPLDEPPRGPGAAGALFPVSGSSPGTPGGGWTGGSGRRGIGLAMGAVPLGGGWLAEGRYQQGLALAFLQIGGAALSLYASSRISAEERDLYGIQDEGELGSVRRWQWTQGLALSTALGAYLYSLIAARRP